MHIAIIDDNQVNLTLMKHLVKHLVDTESSTHIDSGQGLDFCLSQEVDLVVVDYMMPAPDGIEFIRAMRAHPDKTDVPILMVTANHDDQVRVTALEAGATDFLNKPVDRTEFLARARNMLALRKSQRLLKDRAALLAEEVQQATQQILDREYDTIVRLSKAAEYRDPETGGHILRMAHYSRVIATRLGLPAAEVDILFKAAPMHDIGKVATPDAVLLKPGRLVADELVIMRQHASIGYEILKDSPSPLLQAAAVIANSHHEKYDGSGYPQGLKGEDIPLLGRIVAIADVFDALLSTRPYKKPWAIEDAVAFMHEQSGQHFCPTCLQAFFSCWDEIEAIRHRYQDEDAAI